ncbi:hypothetical protein RRG08_031691 [Elysia crispata]|uniref:Uncharacterized protein n=1 Tax=Elysia crispata TaxID=231223 RepID=A0AAE1AAA2_9GAST|nr:hypothetical protein RRG08_031691 [Elysia crispata]
MVYFMSWAPSSQSKNKYISLRQQHFKKDAQLTTAQRALHKRAAGLVYSYRLTASRPEWALKLTPGSIATSTDTTRKAEGVGEVDTLSLKLLQQATPVINFGCLSKLIQMTTVSKIVFLLNFIVASPQQLDYRIFSFVRPTVSSYETITCAKFLVVGPDLTQDPGVN